MYIALTGSENNKDVYIYHSFRKENGKSSSRIYKKLGKYNTLLEQFDGDRDKMMAWAREQADKETKLYKEATGKISVEFSKAACIPMNERRSFNVGYLFLQELCTQLRIDKICRTSGYIPSYTRTELTDSLHKTFGFRTDYEFITKASMRTIIKETKQIKSKKS